VGALQLLLKGKMEEAWQKKVAKNPYKYGSIIKVPAFVLERDFIKHTPYAKWSKEDGIPFWVKIPFHLEYLLINEDSLKHIFQGLFGETAFYHQNPGFDSTAGDRKILAEVLMRHIAMVRSKAGSSSKG
jgi:hypothetical protein